MLKNQATNLHDIVTAKLRVMKHLPTGDLSLIVLKGHLLIEELLYAIVARSMTRHPQSITAAHLSFFQLAQIAKAVSYTERTDRIWDAILALNTLRNTFAHDLEAKNLGKNLRAFARAVAPHSGEAEKLVLADPEKQIGDGVEFICGVLAALAFAEEN